MMTCHAFKVLGEALGHVDDEDGVLVKVRQIGLIILPIFSKGSSQKFEKSHSMLEGVRRHPFSNFYKFSKRSHRILNKITIHAWRCMTTSKQSWLKRLRHWRRWNNGWRYEIIWVYFITSIIHFDDTKTAIIFIYPRVWMPRSTTSSQNLKKIDKTTLTASGFLDEICQDLSYVLECHQEMGTGPRVVLFELLGVSFIWTQEPMEAGKVNNGGYLLWPPGKTYRSSCWIRNMINMINMNT